MAGHADGIQPRTIEVLQVRARHSADLSLQANHALHTELRSGGSSPPRGRADAHGGVLQSQRERWDRAHGAHGGRARADRALPIQGALRLFTCNRAQTAEDDGQVTLNQGAIESIFLDSMATMGLEVERPVAPTSIQLATDESVLKDPHSYAATVVLRNLAAEPGQADTEMVHAKYVVGADGKYVLRSW